MPHDILLPLLTYPDPTPDTGIARAVDFAATLGGRLTVLAHEVDVPRIDNPLAEILIGLSQLAATAELRSHDTAGRLTQEARRAAERLSIPAEARTMRCSIETMPDALGAAGRTHDLALLALDPSCAEHLAAAEGLLFGSGGPVVVFPAADAPVHLETVAVAWDGGRAGARAVRDALPLLRRARQTRIITVGDEKPIASATVAALQAFLAGHGIDAAHDDVELAGRSIGEALQAEAVRGDAGLLVMGAYGHNRVREFVLGGATRTVLSTLRLPTLMSH